MKDISISEFEFRKILIHSTEELSPLEKLIIRVINKLKLITRLEIHLISQFSLALIDQALEEFHSEGYLDYSFPFDREKMQSNIELIKTELVEFKPSQEFEKLLSHSNLKQYQLTSLGRKLAKTFKRDSQKEEEKLEVAVLAINNNRLYPFIDSENKLFFEKKIPIEMKHFLSIEKFLLENQDGLDLKDKKILGFKQNTEIYIGDLKNSQIVLVYQSGSEMYSKSYLKSKDNLIELNENIKNKFSRDEEIQSFLTLDNDKIREYLVKTSSDLLVQKDKLEEVNLNWFAGLKKVTGKRSDAALMGLEIRTIINLDKIYELHPDWIVKGITNLEIPNFYLDGWNAHFTLKIFPNFNQKDLVFPYIYKRIRLQNQKGKIVTQESLQKICDENINFLLDLNPVEILLSSSEIANYIHSSEIILSDFSNTTENKENRLIYFLEDLIDEDFNNFLKELVVNRNELQIASRLETKILIELKFKSLIKIFLALKEKSFPEIERECPTLIKQKVNYSIILLPENIENCVFLFSWLETLQMIKGTLISKRNLNQLLNKKILKNLESRRKYDFQVDGEIAHEISEEALENLINTSKKKLTIEFDILELEIENYFKQIIIEFKSEGLICNSYRWGGEERNITVYALFDGESYKSGLNNYHEMDENSLLFKLLTMGSANINFSTKLNHNLSFRVIAIPDCSNEICLIHPIALLLTGFFKNKFASLNSLSTKIEDYLSSFIEYGQGSNEFYKQVDKSLFKYQIQDILDTIRSAIPLIVIEDELKRIFLEKFNFLDETDILIYEKEIFKILLSCSADKLKVGLNDDEFRAIFLSPNQKISFKLIKEGIEEEIQYSIMVFPKSNDEASLREFLLLKLQIKIDGNLLLQSEILDTAMDIFKELKEMGHHYRIEIPESLDLLNEASLIHALNSRLNKHLIFLDEFIKNDIQGLFPNLSNRNYKLNSQKGYQVELELKESDLIEAFHSEELQQIIFKGAKRTFSIKIDNEIDKEISYFIRVKPSNEKAFLILLENSIKVLNITNEKKLRHKLENLYEYHVKNSNLNQSLNESLNQNKTKFINNIIQKMKRFRGKK